MTSTNGQQDVESGAERSREATQALDDVRVLLRDDDRRFRDDDQDDDREDQQDHQTRSHQTASSGLTSSVSRSARTTTQR